MMYKMRFRKFHDPSKFETQLMPYFEDELKRKYIIKKMEIEEYIPGKSAIEPFAIEIDTSDEELKRMSREIYQDETTETAYLKGSLQATKDHLQDMRTLVFKNSEVINEQGQ